MRRHHKLRRLAARERHRRPEDVWGQLTFLRDGYEDMWKHKETWPPWVFVIPPILWGVCFARLLVGENLDVLSGWQAFLVIVLLYVGAVYSYWLLKRRDHTLGIWRGAARFSAMAAANYRGLFEEQIEILAHYASASAYSRDMAVKSQFMAIMRMLCRQYEQKRITNRPLRLVSNYAAREYLILALEALPPDDRPRFLERVSSRVLVARFRDLPRILPSS